MYSINGKITSINDRKIIIATNSGVTYRGDHLFELDRGVDAKVGEVVTIYAICYWNEFESTYLFFNNANFRNIFESVLKIKQIGIKTAKTIFSTFNSERFLKIVQDYEVQELQKVKGLGSMTAHIVIDELNKVLFNQKMSAKQEKIVIALQRLGFKLNAIYKVIKSLDTKLSEDELLKKAIGMLSNNEY